MHHNTVHMGSLGILGWAWGGSGEPYSSSRGLRGAAGAGAGAAAVLPFDATASDRTLCRGSIGMHKL